jgi:hypothetical protein
MPRKRLQPRMLEPIIYNLYSLAMGLARELNKEKSDDVLR